jgi:colicin import membrane protein
MAKNPTSKTGGKKKKNAAVKKGEEKKIQTSKKAPTTSSQKDEAAAGQKAAAKPVTTRELLARRFAPLETRPPVKPPLPDMPSERFSAPPFFEADSKTEAKRLREVLSRTYDYETIKAAAEKAAAEKAAAEKAAAERAAEKAAAEKAAAEKAAAEKAAAEKAAAEKAAAEKAAAEKAAAEKAAAEKAAAERAAEQAAAEKAAAEKAAAEKAAAEKAAARKAAADKEPKVAVAYDTTAKTKGSDPMGTAVKAAAAGFALVLLLIIGTSFVNSGKYYLKTQDGVLEIWKGHFAPIGEGLYLSLPGVAAPEPLKDLYTQKEVLPLASQFYMDRADALLAAGGIPDFESIQAELQKADQYAATEDFKSQVASRLTAIELMTLLYRADVAASKGTPEDLAAAAADLEKAARLNLDDAQAALVQRRLEAVTSQPPQMIPLAPAAVTVDTAPEAEAEAEASPEDEPAAAPEEAVAAPQAETAPAPAD